MKKYFYLACTLLCWLAYATNLYALNPSGFSSGAPVQKAVSEIENRTIYGIILHNADFNYQYGIGTFNSSNPKEMELLFPWTDGLSIFAGAAANGEYYGFFYVYDNVSGPIADSFSKINLRTGEIKPIKDWSDKKFKFQDMTYDYSTQTMYGLGFEEGTSYLYTIDLETGDVTRGTELEKTLATLAASYDGRLFGLDLSGTLYQIDKEIGNLTMIMKLKQPIYTMQSMEFDHTDGALYWCSDVYDSEDPEMINRLFKIDVENKTYKKLETLGEYGQAQVIGLYIPYVLAGFEAPGQATELKAVPAEEGKEEVTISWKNPTKTHGGDPLTGGISVTLKRDGEIISNTVSQAGETMSWTDKEVVTGEHVYTIMAASGEKGNGAEVSIDTYVGPDVPTYVEELTNLPGKNCASMLLDWEAPSEGAHKGYYDASSVKYKIIRYPDNVVVAEDVETTSYEDKSIARLGSYWYGIIPSNSAGVGRQRNTSYKIVAGKAIDIPYSCEFNDENLAQNQWNISDGNGDRLSWKINSGLNVVVFGDDGVYAAEYIQDAQGNQNDADEWLISPPLNFEANKNYYVSFDVRSYGQDEFNFTFGDLNIPSAQTIVVPGLTTLEDEMSFQHREIQIPAELITEGVHCFGFNLVTRFGMSGYFQITNISIQEGIADAINSTVAENKAAVSLNEDQLSVLGTFDTADIYTATGMCIASLNNDNSQIDTANWQPGVYLVKVTDGEAVYTTKVIIK